MKTTYLFVELHDAQCGEDPGTGRRDDLRISKADPLQYLGTRLRSAATEGIIAHYQRSRMDKTNIKILFMAQINSSISVQLCIYIGKDMIDNGQLEALMKLNTAQSCLILHLCFSLIPEAQVTVVEHYLLG